MKRSSSLLLTVLAASLIGSSCGVLETGNDPVAGESLSVDEGSSPVGDTEMKEEKDKPDETSRSTSEPTDPSVNDDQFVTQTVAYPTGIKETSALLLQKVLPSEVRAGEPFEFRIEVTNLTDLILEAVTVSDRVSDNLEPESSDPLWAQNRNGTLVWELGQLEAHETRIIRLNAVVDAAGLAQSCATVTYRNSGICSSITVVRPKLELSLEMPPEALTCEDLKIDYTLKNTGNGSASNVRIRHTLPTNLVTEQGYTSYQIKAGTLSPGESITRQVTVKARDLGRFQTSAVVIADGNLHAQSNDAVMTVVKPKLQISCAAPKQAHLRRAVRYRIEATNAGTAVSDSTVVKAIIPAEAEILDIGSDGEKIDDKLVWQLGSLKPNETQQLTFVLSGAEPGTFHTTSQIEGSCAEPASSSTITALKGISAIRLEVIDQDDPIEVGNNVTYTIRVKNQGTAPGTNILLHCDLEDGMEYVDSSGPTKGSVNGSRLEFAPIEALEPQAERTWEVKIKASAAKDARFKVELNSAEMSRPVEETEATHFYE